MSSPTRIVLVVEPSPVERSQVCELISQMGYLPVEASDAPEADDQLAQARPDVILLSDSLEAEAGLRALESWRDHEDSRDVPVLMISRASDPYFLLRALEVGASDFVRMPCDGVDLGARLQSAIRLIELNEDVVRLSDRDRQTGLPNRRAFVACLRREIERITRHGGELALAMLDLDHFASVNEIHGRAVGDEVLASVARGLDSRLRAPDLVARWGGGSFAIVLPETGLDQALRTLDRLRIEVRERAASRSVPGLCVTFSAGVVELDPLNGLADVHHLIKTADAALGHAKRGGRDKVMLAREAV